MLNEDIKAVESVMLDGGVWSHKREAWYRIKKFIAESENTFTNSKSTKSICDTCKNVHCTYPENRCYKTVIVSCGGHE